MPSPEMPIFFKDDRPGQPDSPQKKGGFFDFINTFKARLTRPKKDDYENFIAVLDQYQTAEELAQAIRDQGITEEQSKGILFRLGFHNGQSEPEVNRRAFERYQTAQAQVSFKKDEKSRPSIGDEIGGESPLSSGGSWGAKGGPSPEKGFRGDGDSDPD